jgi:rhomboid protease GluP
VTLPSTIPPEGADAESASAVVFRGSKRLCHEHSLVLEARGIEHELRENGDSCSVCVPPSLLQKAYEELSRYATERGMPRRAPEPAIVPHSGAGIGIFFYILILLAIAYCAGVGLLNADWLAAGALDANARGEWWRTVTALTLHLDQEHLLGNVLFGVIAGIAASRLLGPGIAWAGIVASAALANYTEALITPLTHRAVGASTAVFAALGILSGMAWRQRLTLRERLWYRWAPLIAGICLLTLLGAGSAHVDVLGHALGFIFGLGLGWAYIRADMPNYRGRRGQMVAGGATLLAICVAWFLALRHAV